MVKTPLIAVALVLKGGGLAAERVSAILEPPSHPSTGDGDGEDGSGARVKWAAEAGGGWRLEITRRSQDVGAVVEDLLATISQREEPFGTIPGVAEAYLHIQSVVDACDSESDHVEFNINRSQLERLRQLGLMVKCGIRPAAKPVG